MKKIISIILIAMQLLTFTAFADVAQLSEAQIEDLYRLGIMTGDENGDLRLEDHITRAEAAKMICVAGDLVLSTENNEKLFHDLNESHWAYQYVSTAKKNGIINGDENGYFHPESNITNEEIVKMIVCLLGYREMAETRGGYPAGYTSTASRLGITKNLNLKADTPALRKDVAMMISNALDVPIMVEKNEGEDQFYTILDGNNGVPFSSIRGTR